MLLYMIYAYDHSLAHWWFLLTLDTQYVNNKQIQRKKMLFVFENVIQSLQKTSRRCQGLDFHPAEVVTELKFMPLISKVN